MRTFPAAPLIAHCRVILGPTIHTGAGEDTRQEGYSVRNAAALCHLNYRAWQRATATGHFTEAAADTAATALGLHPAELWGDWFLIGADELERDARRAESRHPHLRLVAA